MAPSSKGTLHIRAYFDFMCPWSYLGKIRLQRALRRIKGKAKIEWIPFELYTHDGHHTVEREKIIGHENLPKTYAQLHEIGARENIIILHPQYESSTRRALTGLLYARKKGVEEKYVDEVFENVFEHTASIHSIPVLYRLAIKMGWNTQEFLAFVDNPVHQNEIVKMTAQAKADGVRGVPTYHINHLPISGALPVSDFVSILQSLQKKTFPAYMLPSTTKTQPKKKTKTKKTVKRVVRTASSKKKKKR